MFQVFFLFEHCFTVVAGANGPTIIVHGNVFGFGIVRLVVMGVCVFDQKFLSGEDLAAKSTDEGFVFGLLDQFAALRNGVQVQLLL